MRALKLLAPVLLLTAALGFLPLADHLPGPKSVTLLFLFIAFNLVVAWAFGLLPRLRVVWHPKGIPLALLGFLMGAAPISLFVLNGHFFMGPILTWAGFWGALCTVVWEELWFRGITLDMAARQYSRMSGALIFAVIFVLLHLMNPEIHWLSAGPELLLAGFSLGACYLIFNSIWAPIGMHMANNWISALYGMKSEPTTWIYILPLSLVALVLGYLLWRGRQPLATFLAA